MTEFASAIADLRLSGEKLNQDAAAVRSQLLRITQQLEQQATVNLNVGIDVRRAQRDLQRAVTQFTSAGAFNIAVGLNTDQALDDLVALTGLEDPLTIPVFVDVDDALGELAALDELARINPAVIPLSVDDDEAIAALDRIERQALPQTVEAFGAAGDAAGRQFADRLSQTAFSAVGTLSLGLGAFVTTSLVRGFQRFSTIEDATASLTVALQSTTQAAIVLDDVLDVVTGTPFNLDQFALAASNLISFGVEAEKVPGFLEAIAEASASRGGRANEFAQRLATTFGQISVQGRITGEDILSLQATGVDALRILGNSFGETTIDIREMISQGIIPAADALDILSAGILDGSTGINGATVAFAGTAERLRETLTGARGGFISATARFGEAIIEPFEEALTQGFNSATEIVNKFTAEIDSLLGGLATTDGFDNFVEKLSELPDLIDPVLEGLAAFGPALAPLAAGFGALGINQLGRYLAPLGLAIPQISGLVLAITALVAATPELREQVVPILGDLGEAAAILSAGLGTALGDTLEALTPLLVEFAEAVGDFTPFITDLATFGAALARGFVPVLQGLAKVLDLFPIEVLAAIGGGLLAFRGLNALTGPIDNLTNRIAGFGAQLQLAEASADRFGNRWTAVAGRFNVSGEQITRAAGALRTGLDSAASAAAGFFSGFAIASENATTQALGFASAATSIATGFATGGGPGGIVASAAVVGGALVKTWTDSKQAAEEYERTIDQVAKSVIDDLGAATAALLDAQRLLGQESVVEEGIDLIGEDDLARLQQYGVEYDTLLQTAADASVGEGLSAAIDAAFQLARQETNAFIAEQRLRGIEPESDTAAAEFARIFRNDLQTEIDRIAGTTGLDLSALLDSAEITGAISSITGFFDLDQIDLGVNIAVDALKTLNDLAGDTAKTIEEELINELARLSQVTGDFGRNFDLDATQIDAFRNSVDALALGADDVRKAIIESDDEIQAYIDSSAQLARVGLTPWDLILRGVEGVRDDFDILVEVNDDGTLTIIENAKETAAAIDGITGSTEALTEALKAADAVAKRFTETLSEQLSILDRIALEQNFVAGFENISAKLGEIVNQKDLDEAQRLIDQIGDGRRSIADLQAQLADEQADANIEIANLDRRIADAQQFGAVEGLAALQRERERVLRDVGKAEREVQEQISEVAVLERELAAIASQVPITFEQVLRGQAGERGISLAELLVSPTATPEARDFFQRSISNQIKTFAEILQQNFDDNPLLASIQLPDLTEGFINQLAASGGLDDATARELVDLVIDPQKLAREARNSFDEAFAADLATLNAATQALLRGEDIDPSINVEATVEDVGDGIAALQELERLGIEIPGGVDLVEAQTTLSAFRDAYEESDFALLIPVEGDLSPIISQLEGLEEYSIQLTLQSPTFGRTPVRGSTSTGRSRGRDPFSGGGAAIPFLDGGFFKEGGVSENHIAQIAGGRTPFRMWAEPETGGEAYIPLGNSKRSRSTQILTSVADIFGMDVIPRSRGAASAAATAFTEESMSRAVERGVTRARGGVPGPAARAAAHDRAARSVNVEKIEVSGVRDPARAARKMIRSLSDVAMGLHDWDDEI